MGADMMLYCVEDPIAYDKAWPLIKHRIENLDESTIEDIADSLLHYEAEELWEEMKDGVEIKKEDLFDLDNLFVIKLQKMVRQRLEDAVTSIIGGPEKEELSFWRRDLAHMNLGGVAYIFTGGMSWGDLPTEACTELALIEAAGLFDGMGSQDFDFESFKA